MAGKCETGVQLLARLGARPDVSKLEQNLFPKGVHQKDVVELYGGEGTGKTQMLLHFMTKCLLPSNWRNIEMGGLNAGVAFVDTDFHFSMIRLAGIMDQTIRRCIARYKRTEPEINNGVNHEMPSEEDVENLIKQCLSKLHIVRCNSSMQFVLSLYSLESVFGNRPEVCLLLIDSISAFYWIDRSNGADNYSAQEMNQRRISDAISKLKEDYNIITIVTKPAIFQKKSKDRLVDRSEGDYSPFVNNSNTGNTSTADKTTEHCEYMCKLWQKLVTHRFIFSKQNIVSQSKSGERKQVELFTVKGGPVGAGSDCIAANFYVTELGILFID